MQARSRLIFIVFCLLLGSAALGTVLATSGRQMSLPGINTLKETEVMPPSPDDWCKKVDLAKLENEIAKAKIFFEEGGGEQLIDWRYLRRALKQTGVSVSGPENRAWLEIIEGLYIGCNKP